MGVCMGSGRRERLEEGEGLEFGQSFRWDIILDLRYPSVTASTCSCVWDYSRED